MGIFDGILIASDWDRTLYCDGKLNKKDIEKIKYFCDNGGSFTLASGRTLNFMRRFFDDIKPNTYAITLNGAVIIHPDTEHILHEAFIESDITQVVDKLLVESNLFHTMHLYFEGEQESRCYDRDMYISKKEEIAAARIYKALLLSDTPEKVKRAKQLVSELEIDGLLFVSSWDTSLEIIAKENAKGYGIRRVAEKIGAKLTVAVGDYENDFQMIEMADIGYAVGNAINELKNIADRVTVDAKDGAISQIISDLERDIRSKK